MRHRGTTALITGASSGIGAAFARGFAARGANVVLVARRADALDDVAAGIRGSYPGVEVTCLPADLARPRPGAALRTRLTERGITVTTLVNCAGLGRTGQFRDTPNAMIHEQIAVNVSALTDLTAAFLPDLLDDGAGALVNVASVTAYLPMPQMAVYGGTKAFVLHFTEALAYELRGTGVRVVSLAPGPTVSEFYARSGTDTRGVRFARPDDVVRTALRALDAPATPASVVSGRMNRLLAAVAGMLPRRLVLRLAASSVRPTTAEK